MGSNYGGISPKDFQVIAAGAGTHANVNPSVANVASFTLPSMDLGDTLYIEIECIPSTTGSIDLSQTSASPNLTFSTLVSSASHVLVGTLTPTAGDITVSQKSTILLEDSKPATAYVGATTGITFNGSTVYVVAFHAVGGTIEYRYLVAKIKKK